VSPRGQTADALTDVLDLKREAERRRAVRALLRHPLITPTRPDAELFVLVRRHSAWLREWFAREAGWTLVVESSVARLYKVPAETGDGSRAAVPEVGPRVPFSRRRYALTCLALAALERADAQVTLGRLVERVIALAADPALEEAGITVTMDSRDGRSDLAAVARLLIGLGVLNRVAGEEQSFVNRTGDALYDLDRRVLSVLLGARRGPSMLAGQGWSGDPGEVVARRIEALVEEIRPDTEDLRTRATRHAIARRLLDDPVVYWAELGEDERAYLRSQRAQLLRRLGEGSGLVPEARAEGVALIDPTGESTDLGMPEEGTDGHVTLLIAEHLAQQLADPESSGVPIPRAELEGHVATLRESYRSYWRKDAVEPGAERELTRQAVARLASLRLVRIVGDGIIPLPALARFSYGPVGPVGPVGSAEDVAMPAESPPRSLRRRAQAQPPTPVRS
jgi:uncharacterized protein (TIGR02678 family)